MKIFIALIYMLLLPNPPIEMDLFVGTWFGEGIELKLEKAKTESAHHFGQFQLIQSYTKLAKSDQSEQSNPIKGLWWLKFPTPMKENTNCISASIDTYHFSCFVEWQLAKDLPQLTKKNQPILILHPKNPSPIQASFVLIIRLSSFLP